MAQDLTGRIAVVSGATAGIGEAAARELVARGARVVLNGRRADRLDALVKELGPDHAVSRAGDAGEQRVVDAMLDTARERFDAQADLVVVNAGRGLGGGVVSSDDAQWEQMIRVNVLGALRLMRAAAQRMIAEIKADAERGVSWEDRPRDIIVLGSVVGRNISPFSAAYGSTKFAVNSAAEAMRREVCAHGVRVSLVEPAIVVSEFQAGAGYDDDWFAGLEHDKGPFLMPEDIARAIAHIAAQPPRVHIADILVRPTRQDYP